MGDPFNAPQPSIPRCCGRQSHRDNIPSDTPEEYFRRSITIPFLDQLIQHMSSRFSALQSTAVRGLCLVPSVFVSLQTSDDLDDLVRMYCDDLPLPATWEAELHCWKFSWQEHEEICLILLLKLSMLVKLSTTLMYTFSSKSFVHFPLLLQHVSVVSVLSGG